MKKIETKTKTKATKSTKTNKKATKSGEGKRITVKKTKSVKQKSKTQKEKLEAALKKNQNGRIITKAELLDGICGNCGNELGDKDKYCHLCGTKRGESNFLPVSNQSLMVYGPPMSYYYKCKKCNHKWQVETLGNLDESKYCPNCGAKQIESTKTINRLRSILKGLE